MAKKIDRSWNKDRIQIWKKDTDGNSGIPLLPPPPLPSNRYSGHFPPHTTPAGGNEWNEGYTRTYNPYGTYVDDSHENLSDYERQEYNSPTTWYDAADIIYSAPIRPQKQIQVVATMQENLRSDRERQRRCSQTRDPHDHDPHDRLPPPPPRLDFPVDPRMSKPEYRRVDEHDDDPRLRAELYPLEEEQPRKKCDRPRQGPETIDILSERIVKEQGGSELNLVPSQRVKDIARMHQYKDDVGPGQRNHGYSADMDDTGQYNARGHERDINTRENSQKFLGSVPDISEGKSSERDRASAACPYSGPQRKKMRDEYDMTYSGANTRSSAEELANREQGHGRKSELARNERQLEYEGMRDKRYGDGLRECGKPEREPPLDYRRTESYERRRQMEDYRDVRPDRKYLPPGTDYAIQRRDEDMAYRRKGSLQYNDIKSHVEGSFDNRMSREDSRRGQKVQGGVENAKSDIHSTPSNIQNKSSRSGYASESHRRGSGESAKTTPSKKIGSGYDALHEEMSNQCGLPVQKRDSVVLPVLEEREREFHELVAAGDVVAVRNFLCEHPRFNINCVNYQNLSALHVAVHEQNEAMVEFLLEQKALDCSDCALYAIKEGNVRIVEKIMDRMRETAPGLEFAPTSHSAHFSDDMTPIILAAQLGNYEIIDFLIKRDHRIPPVHGPYCKCEACKKDLLRFDRLRYSTMKLNQYKAICNPMYLFHVTDDPFQRAFDLCRELQDAAKVFPQFKSDYEDLWKGLRNFTVELIGCCRNAQEVEIILKKSANNFAGSITFPRLQYAIDLKQKEFVSHPFTQAVLVDAWTGDLLEWKVQSPLMQALSVFPRIPMLPVMAVMCMFLPNHRLVRKWKTPVNKMISSVASYLIFLVILFLESNLDKRNQKRGPPDSGLEGLIIIYVIGYVWLNIRVCFKLGPKRFFSTMWHWFDCIMLFFFSLTIMFWIASLADVTANNEIDLPRKYWNSLDPELIAEGFFAAAVIMAFFRLNMFLSLNYHLGPLQVSIGKMTLDIFRFIIIFIIIILAWCAGLCKFYQPYDGMVQKDAASGSSTTQISSFVSFPMTLKTFFWAIFGMSPIESADVVIENLPGDTPDTTIINHHEFTETVGYIAFALFQFLSVVVVLNMLVACMANTFTKVIDNVTVEWVFGRSQIYLSFMAASTLPPPFNLLPTAAGVKTTLLWLKLLATKPKDGKRARCNAIHCCYIESEPEEYVNTEFPALMSQLAQRYLHLKGQSLDEHDELEELKCEVKELLRKIDKLISLRKSSEQFKW